MEYALTLEEEGLEETRSRTAIILAETALLEEELGGEPELLELIFKFEEEYHEFNLELEVIASAYYCGDMVDGVQSAHIAMVQEAHMEEGQAVPAHEIELDMEESFASAERAHAMAAQLILWVSGLAIALGLGLSFFLSGCISNGVRKMSASGTDLAERVLPSLAEVIRTVAGGDLSKNHNLKVEPLESVQ